MDETRVLELQRELNVKEEKITFLQNTLRGLTAENDELLEKNDTLTKSYSALQKDHAIQISANAKLKRDVEKKTEQLAEMRSKLNQEQTKVAEMVVTDLNYEPPCILWATR